MAWNNVEMATHQIRDAILLVAESKKTLAKIQRYLDTTQTALDVAHSRLRQVSASADTNVDAVIDAARNNDVVVGA